MTYSYFIEIRRKSKIIIAEVKTMPVQDTTHKDHRQRLKNRFREEGLDNFHPRHVLELLLFFCLPRIDTAPLAQALIDHFGSLDLVLEATAEELEKVPGVGPNVSTLLTLIPQLSRYCHVKQNDKKQPAILNTTDLYGNFLVPRFDNRRNETVFLLCLDAKCKLLCCKEVGEGSVNSASIPIRRVVEMALGCNASMVVLAHNHPSGLALPSGEDIQTTRRMAMALDAVEITLADHIVVADGDFVSMVQSGYYRPGEYRVLV
jgi:DNA repair protein RadC